MSQRFLFVKEWVTNRPGGLPNKAKPIQLDQKPKRVWTLYTHSEPECPTTPFVPQHHRRGTSSLRSM